MIQTLKNIILLSLCASFCVAVSPSNTENSQNKAVNSKNSNLQISQNNEIESKNTNLQIPASSDKITTLSQNANLQNDKKIAKNAEFESIKTLEFPKDEAEEKQLNELFMAIESLNSDKIQKLVKQNPRLVNLQSEKNNEYYFARVYPIFYAIHIYAVTLNNKDRALALQNIKYLLDNKANLNTYKYKYIKNDVIYADSILSDIISLFLYGFYYNNFDENLKLLDFLIEYGKLDINFPYQFRNIPNSNSKYILPHLCKNFLILPDEYRFKIFKFLINKKVKSGKMLICIIKTTYGLNAVELINKAKATELYEYIDSFEYKYERDMMKKYIYELFANYTINDFDIQELIEAGKYFVYTKDAEFINLMINNGYLKNDDIYENMLKAAQKPKNENIIKLIQGARK